MIPKFRAWDKRNKEMIKDVVSIHFNTEMIATSNLYFYPFKDIELMQSTGLMDKNGVEIYEGDILERKNNKRTFAKGAVEFIQREACWGVDIFYLKDLYRTSEVIGNIYENPELLKGDEHETI